VGRWVWKHGHGRAHTNDRKSIRTGWKVAREGRHSIERRRAVLAGRSHSKEGRSNRKEGMPHMEAWKCWKEG
jgi:hypothetical protein